MLTSFASATNQRLPAAVGGRRRSAGVSSSTTRGLYLAALSVAETQPLRGSPDAALHAFLTLNAGYFLGEWLPVRIQATLVRRLASALDGIAGLPLPADPVHDAQLAQHVRELALESGATPWTAAIMEKTAALVPQQPEDWDADVRAAASRLAGTGGDGHALLYAHARRRLWELAHPSPSTGGSPPSGPAAVMRCAARTAAVKSGHAVQITEAALAEISCAPGLAAELLAAVTGT